MSKFLDDSYHLTVLDHCATHWQRLVDFHNGKRPMLLDEYVDTCQAIEDKINELKQRMLDE